MSKFAVGDLVRVTNPNLVWFDRTGKVFEIKDNDLMPFRVKYSNGETGRYQAQELTLADPDVHTVLDQMDAESAPCITAEQWAKAFAPDPVNHPAHYGGDATYETIKVIEAWGLGFSLGNCVKYLSRAGKKGPVLEDLRKARFYLDREIAAAEAAQ